MLASLKVSIYLPKRTYCLINVVSVSQGNTYFMSGPVLGTRENNEESRDSSLKEIIFHGRNGLLNKFKIVILLQQRCVLGIL